MSDIKLSRAQVAVLRRMAGGATLRYIDDCGTERSWLEWKDGRGDETVRNRTIIAIWAAKMIIGTVCVYNETFCLTARARTYLKEHPDV